MFNLVEIDSINGYISTSNSSLASLGGGAVFTGVSEDVSCIASIVVSIFTDQNSANNGLSIQFSSDGTNWDFQYNYTITANTGKVISFIPKSAFFRIVYTNGATLQSAFRLQAMLHPTRTAIEEVAVTGSVNTELADPSLLADATSNPTVTSIGAFLHNYNGSNWDRVRGDTANGIDVDVTRLPSIPAGTNNIGDVDIVTVPPPLSTTGGGTEETALRVTIANNSTGVLSVKNNGSPLLVDGSSVTQPVSVASLPLPTGAATLAEQQTQTTALQLLKDLVHTFNTALNKLVAIGGQFDDTAVTLATENNVAPLRITENRALHSNLRNASGTEVGVIANPLIVQASSPTITEYTEDAIAAINPIGSMSMAVRADTLPVVTDADGDNIALRSTNKGELHVKHKDQLIVLNKTADDQEISVRDAATYSSATNSGHLTGSYDPLNKVRLSTGNIYGASNIDFTERLLTSEKELKTAQTTILGSFSHTYGIDPLFFGTSISGSGAVSSDTTQSSALLSVSTLNADRARLRTHQYYHLLVNNGLGVKIDLKHSNSGVSNQTRRWGLFDDNDGIFFELTSTTLKIVLRSNVSGSPVATEILQSAWNVDQMNGSGLSGLTLDITKINNYEIEINSLRTGNINFYINNYLVHRLVNFNIISSAYLRVTQLPLQFEIVNTGVSTASSFNFYNGAVYRQSGIRRLGYSFSAANSAQKTITTTEIPLLCIRPKATFGGITNRIVIVPKVLNIETEGSRASFRIILNPTTLTGSTFNSVNANSGVEFDVASTAFTGGTVVFKGFLPNTNENITLYLNELFNDLHNNLKQNAFATAVDTLVITAFNEAAGSVSMRACIGWEEYR